MNSRRKVLPTIFEESEMKANGIRVQIRTFNCPLLILIPLKICMRDLRSVAFLIIGGVDINIIPRRNGCITLLILPFITRFKDRQI